VIGTATSEKGVAKIADSLPSSIALQMKIDEDESVASAYSQIQESGELPCILINNAGITADNLIMRMSQEEWSSVINTNVNGLYRVTKPLVRGMMKARWGRVVNISSVVARMGSPGQANYVASKAAIEGFTRSLALELASRNITVNAIAPGFIETDMTSELTQDQSQAILDRVPLGRMGKPEEVSAAVEFLISDAAAYITGQTLQVNGGLYNG
jgi:3-oxoacyl-[acyl-carrier protein] reductase